MLGKCPPAAASPAPAPPRPRIPHGRCQRKHLPAAPLDPPDRSEIGVAGVPDSVSRVIVINGSLQVGIGWGAEGPQAGFFPFYIGLLILFSSVVNLAARAEKATGPSCSPNGASSAGDVGAPADRSTSR